MPIELLSDRAWASKASVEMGRHVGHHLADGSEGSPANIPSTLISRHHPLEKAFHAVKKRAGARGVAAGAFAGEGGLKLLQ